MNTPEILSYTIDYSTLDFGSCCVEELWCGRDYFNTREEVLEAVKNWDKDFNHILHHRLHVRGPDINRYVPVNSRDHVRTWSGILARRDALIPDSYDEWVESHVASQDMTCHENNQLLDTYAMQYVCG